MGKSARILGREFARSAREMNGLLKEHGYLDGEPGAYELTAKGQRYAEEQYNHRGTGGYAYYNANWTTRTWNDETIVALKADMAAEPAGPDPEPSPGDDEDVFECSSSVGYGDDGSSADDDPPPSWGVVVLGAVIIGARIVAPYAKPYWNEKLQPKVTRMRDKLTKRAPGEIKPAEDVDG